MQEDLFDHYFARAALEERRGSLPNTTITLAVNENPIKRSASCKNPKRKREISKSPHRDATELSRRGSAISIVGGQKDGLRAPLQGTTLFINSFIRLVLKF